MSEKIQLHNLSAHDFEQCLKCSICTVYCPVSAVEPNYPGPKHAGPDLMRYRMKDPDFFNETLKLCLNCKRCEVACPHGVKVGDIIQEARIQYSQHSPSLRDRMLANTDFVGSMATLVAPLTNFFLGLSPAKTVLDKVMKIDHHRQFPAYSGTMGQDFVKIMNACGYGVHLLEKEKCCGVALIANGLSGQAKRQGENNIQAMRRSLSEGNEAVLTTSSTCTFTMRDEYPDLLKVDNQGVRDSLMLATRFLCQKIDEGKIKLVFRKDYHKKVAYHTACHMERMGWTLYSTQLLKMIPGLDFMMLDSHCCGIAGTYGFKKENYERSQKIGAPLFQQIKEVNPDYVSTDCETCKWQIEMSTGYLVMNPISILADALDVEATKALNQNR